MTMLYSSQGTITFPVAAGNTLVVKNISGTETVSGSIVSRESAAGYLGSGSFAYGPQPTAVTVTLSTSGQCDYSIVAGDVTSPTSTIGTQANLNGLQTLDDKSVNLVLNGPAPIAQNWKLSNTATLRYMLQSAGYQRSILLFNGDSYLQGRKAAGNGDVGARKFSSPVQIANALNSAGFQAQHDSVTGWLAPSPNSVAGYVAYDPRVSYSGSVISTPGYAGLGYQMWQIPASGTVVFTPGGTFDTLDVFWPALAGAGTFTVTDGGGVKATIDTSASPGAIRSQTVTLAAGTTSITFTSTSGNSNIAFWRVRTAASPGIEVVMAGGAGLPLNQFAPTAVSAPYGTQGSVTAMSSGLKMTTVLDGWYNDYAQPRTLAQYQADLRTVLAYFKSKGDVVFLNYAKLSPSLIDEATFQTWSAAARDIVINEYDCPWLDMSQIIPDNAAAYSAGIMNSDLLHLEKPGHTMVKDAFMRALRGIM